MKDYTFSNDQFIIYPNTSSEVNITKKNKECNYCTRNNNCKYFKEKKKGKTCNYFTFTEEWVSANWRNKGIY